MKIQRILITLLLGLSCETLGCRLALADDLRGDKLNQSREEIVLGGGCFWCIEAIFQNFKGIDAIESGYAGGTVPDPTYEQVSSGSTGHAEVVKVSYDPKVITLKQVLTIFFHAHDPTTKDRQGHDVGTQYRSVVLFSTEAQKNAATEVMNEITTAKVWDAPLVTQVEPLKAFYKAENYHQNYFKSHPEQPYCSLVIGPKVKKVRLEFRELLR